MQELGYSNQINQEKRQLFSSQYADPVGTSKISESLYHQDSINNGVTIEGEVYSEKTDVLALQIILQDNRLISQDNEDGEHSTIIEIHIERQVDDLLKAIDKWLSRDRNLQEIA